MKNRRLTGLYMLRRPMGGSGYEKPQSGFALFAVFSPPHLGQGTFAMQSPLTCPKRQLPRTLYAIGFELNKKYLT
jgi:hypothetical protein